MAWKCMGLTLGLMMLALSGRAYAEDKGCQALARSIDPAVQKLMETHDLPGLALGLTVNGRPCYFNYGVASRADSRPVTEETLFEIGSLSKTFTAVLAALAQAEGRLNLSDPVSRHLPELAGSAFDRVTLLNLATHTAGLPLTLPGEVKTADQLKKYYLNWPPPYEPGSARTYSNPGTALLGRAAAASLEESFETMMTTRLLPGLGLERTFIKVPEDSLQGYAQGYNKNNQPVRLSNDLLSTEAYALKSCPRDLIRYIEIYLGLTEVEPGLREALDQTMIAHYQVGGLHQALMWEYFDYPADLKTMQSGGSADMIFKDNPAEALAPAERPKVTALYNKTGSTNGFATYAAFVPETKTGLVLLANRPFPIEERMALAHQIFAELNGRPADPQRPEWGNAPPQDVLAGVVRPGTGLYRHQPEAD